MADKKPKNKIQLEVYDEVIEVNIGEGEEEMYHLIAISSQRPRNME